MFAASATNLLLPGFTLGQHTASTFSPVLQPLAALVLGCLNIIIVETIFVPERLASKWLRPL